MSLRLRSSDRHTFTVVELLVVIAIIAILAYIFTRGQFRHIQAGIG